MPEHASFRETACESDSKSDHDRSIARKSECLPEHASFRETACESDSKSDHDRSIARKSDHDRSIVRKSILLRPSYKWLVSLPLS